MLIRRFKCPSCEYTHAERAYEKSESRCCDACESNPNELQTLTIGMNCHVEVCATCFETKTPKTLRRQAQATWGRAGIPGYGRPEIDS